ncbi:uncharacterized protein JCM15063_000834 [Sporobolomyces koalae]|uniref:uncharacterized protein n=1 Tax=Sporobolomyces koalae TaxID=500713 RepID=UPI0031819299
MPLLISPYISPYTPYFRSVLYFLTWLVYYLSYLVSPVLLTVVQLVVNLVNHLLPRIEWWFEVECRGRLRTSVWAQQSWRNEGKSIREWVRDRGYIDRRVVPVKGRTVSVDDAANWSTRGIERVWNWLTKGSNHPSNIVFVDDERPARNLVPPTRQIAVAREVEPPTTSQRLFRSSDLAPPAQPHLQVPKDRPSAWSGTQWRAI